MKCIFSAQVYKNEAFIIQVNSVVKKEKQWNTKEWEVQNNKHPKIKRNAGKVQKIKNKKYKGEI